MELEITDHQRVNLKMRKKEEGVELCRKPESDDIELRREPKDAVTSRRPEMKQGVIYRVQPQFPFLNAIIPRHPTLDFCVDISFNSFSNFSLLYLSSICQDL